MSIYKIHFYDDGSIISIRNDNEQLNFFGEHNIIEIDSSAIENGFIEKMIKNENNEWVIQYLENN